MKNLPVYTEQGEKIGEVCDLMISRNGQINEVVVSKKHLFKKPKTIGVKQIFTCGPDGILVKNIAESPSPDTSKPISYHQNVDGKRLLTAKGEDLGIVKDVYFTEDLGTIVGYEFSDGFFSDITEGKHIARTTLPAAIGKDAIIINVND
nr:PRC-barrel domain-containing protein [Peribacillus deserti]